MLSLLIFFITCLIYWQWYTRRHPDEPPILPGAWPFVGHAHMLIGDTLNFWTWLKNISHKCIEMGHVSYFYTGPFKFYGNKPVCDAMVHHISDYNACYVLASVPLLTDPDDIYKLSNTCIEKDQFSYSFTKDLLGNGLLYAHVPTWKKHRKLINPAFNQQILDGFIDIFNKQGKKLVNNLQVEVDKGSFDHSEYVRQNAMETICLTALDDAITEDEADKYVKSFESYLNTNTARFLSFWLYPDFIYKYSSLKKKQDKCVKYLEELSDSVLRKKRASRELNNITEPESQPKLKVFMDLLMDLDNGALTDQEIRDEMNTIMMAGHDTSANVTIFALLLIGSYPKVQERIYNELQEILQDKDIEKQDLSRLVYLEAVLKETMRYYVMAPFVGRYIDREVKLKNCTLKPGNNCFILMYGVHRNPQWGPDVNDFKPERWLDPDTMPKNPNMFVGFSLGKRNCIGKTYAMMSMKAVLSHVLRKYKIHADHTKVVLKLDVLLKPVSGHFISIEDRSKA